MNTVNTTNFNQTAMGYLEIALSYTKLSDDEKLDVYKGMRRALDENTMEEARKYLEGE